MQDICAIAAAVLDCIMAHLVGGLARQGEHGRTIAMFQCQRPSLGGFHGVCRTEHAHIRHGAKTGEYFNRLMGWAV